MVDCCYSLVRQAATGLFSLRFNGVEIATGLEFGEAVIMLETLLREVDV